MPLKKAVALLIMAIGTPLYALKNSGYTIVCLESGSNDTSALTGAYDISYPTPDGNHVCYIAFTSAAPKSVALKEKSRHTPYACEYAESSTGSICLFGCTTHQELLGALSKGISPKELNAYIASSASSARELLKQAGTFEKKGTDIRF